MDLFILLIVSCPDMHSVIGAFVPSLDRQIYLERLDKPVYVGKRCVMKGEMRLKRCHVRDLKNGNMTSGHDIHSMREIIIP
jgi:hypothetical protein